VSRFVLWGIGVDSQRVERRLSATLAADIARYSRLIGIEEEGTLAASNRKDLTPPQRPAGIAGHTENVRLAGLPERAVNSR
jgi:adenylate cyclase